MMEKAKKETKYFNFPIQLIEGFMSDKDTVLAKIRDYAVFMYIYKLDPSLRKTLTNKHIYDYFGIDEFDVKIRKTLFDSIPENSPTTGINTKVWMDYFENKKSEYEMICLVAFLALKSIVRKGTKRVVNNYWLARMDGKTNKISDLSDLSVEIRKYGNEYQLVKIKHTLKDSWGLKHYSYYTRGFYASFANTLDNVVLFAESERSKNKDKAYQAAVKEARLKALQVINKPDFGTTKQNNEPPRHRA